MNILHVSRVDLVVNFHASCDEIPHAKGWLSPIWGMSFCRFTPIVAMNVSGVLCCSGPDPVSSVQPIDGFGAMASLLLSTPTKSKAAQGPVVTDPQPKLRQLSLRVCLHLDPQDTAGTPEKPKRQYKARGTGGTFGGQRPPKAWHLKADFEQRRSAHQSGVQAKKATKSNSYADRAYHKFAKEMLPSETEGPSQYWFQRVAQQWNPRRHRNRVQPWRMEPFPTASLRSEVALCSNQST